MEIIIYITIFFIGLLAGSFSTLAIHRLPLHEDITHKRSYCPKCKHKLSFFDMIPVISYICLKGKCRYCKEKISPKYIIIEFFTGLIFVAFSISVLYGTQINNVEIIVYLAFNLLYILGLIIIAGIDKEKRVINVGVLLYELIIVSSYMIYLYILRITNVYIYVMYLFIILTLLICDTFYLRRKLENNYSIQIILLIVIMLGFGGKVNLFVTIFVTLLAIAIKYLLQTIIGNKNSIKKMPIAYLLCIFNIIVTILMNLGWFKWVIL